MTYTCGLCFRQIEIRDLGRNYYGEVLCKTCYTETNNETLNERKLRLVAERTELDLQIAEINKKLEARRGHLG